MHYSSALGRPLTMLSKTLFMMQSQNSHLDFYTIVGL